MGMKATKENKMKQLSDKDIKETLDSKSGTDHERFVMVARKAEQERDKEWRDKLESYNGSYIDKRFWKSRFWQELKQAL